MRYYARYDTVNNRLYVSGNSQTPANHVDMMNSPNKQIANVFCIGFLQGVGSGVTPVNSVHEFADN
jgi:hypothetical protein